MISHVITHKPVLLKEVLEGLISRKDGYYVDCTFGGGGHSHGILQYLTKTGTVLAIDRDPKAMLMAQKRSFSDDSRFRLVGGSFAMLKAIVTEHGILGKIDGILFDLGISSLQLADSSRGFSFQDDGPLDMRMDTTTGPSAADWLAVADEVEIVEVLYRFGEERKAKQIADRIVQQRKINPLVRTRQLANIVSGVYKKYYPARSKRHPATQTFQAIRIHINQELSELEQALSQTLEVLSPKGRLVVISFHSLEDRIVKRFIQEQAMVDPYSKELPLPIKLATPLLRKIGRAIRPKPAEINMNPRARSAILRISERTAS